MLKKRGGLFSPAGQITGALVRLERLDYFIPPF